MNSIEFLKTEGLSDTDYAVKDSDGNVSIIKLSDVLDRHKECVLSCVGDSWLSPVESERKWQEKHLLKIWDNYPNATPLWQYMNGLIRFSCERLDINVD